MKFTDTFINSFNDGFMECLIGTTPNTLQKTGTFEHRFQKHLNSVYTFI